MQEIIQSLEQNKRLTPDKDKNVITEDAEPLKDKLHPVPPAKDNLSQDYTIQDDMEGLTGKLGGLFGM